MVAPVRKLLGEQLETLLLLARVWQGKSNAPALQPAPAECILDSDAQLDSRLEELKEVLLTLRASFSGSNLPQGDAVLLELWANRQTRALSEVTLVEAELARVVQPSSAASQKLLEDLSVLCKETAAFIRAAAEQLEMEERGRKGADMRLVTTLSREQNTVVHCPQSIFVQGRSGTGKTLVLVRRMVLRCSTNKLGLFVTRSSKLRDHVKRDLLGTGIHLLRQEPGLSYGWGSSCGLICLAWSELVELFGRSAWKDPIGYDGFAALLDRLLGSQARSRLGAPLLWSEFNTQIRSFHQQKHVSKDEYMEQRTAALGLPLAKRDREIIWDSFLRFQRWKQSHERVDDVDVAQALLAELRSGQLDMFKVDELYVDEAQDFSPAELMALVALCRSPSGVSMAGDTCQTINPGSAFCFADLVEAFQKSWELGSDMPLSKSEACEVPCAVHYLRVNFRSSRGVSAVASSVVELLLARFPRAVDLIEGEIIPELGGEVPLALELPNASPAARIMGRGDWHHPAGLDPVRMVILVRSHKAREDLRRQGVQGVVLTVAESKGLEFDICILCNILSGSGFARHTWCLADVNSTESLVLEAQTSRGLEKLTPEERQLLCQVAPGVSELKLLYVAMTRARVGFVLLECGDKPAVNAPLLHLWKGRDLIDVWSGEEEFLRTVLQQMSPLDVPTSCKKLAPTQQRTKNREFVFEPGRPGMKIDWVSREVQSVTPGAQAARMGVQAGWRVHSLRPSYVCQESLQPFFASGAGECSMQGFEECLLSNGPYIVTFLDILDESVTLEEGVHDAESERANAGGYSREQTLDLIQRRLDEGLGKKARDVLKQEQKRLQHGGRLDPNFLQRFEKESGLNIRRTVVDASVTAGSSVPSLVPLIRQRFYTSSAGPVSARQMVDDLERQGMDIYVHAADDSRERWGAFEEARRVFSQALSAVKMLLIAQMSKGAKRSLSDSEEIHNFEAEPYLAISGLLLAALERRPSWRGQNCVYRLWTKHSILVNIFVFLAPCETTFNGAWAAVARCRERVLEHWELRRRLVAHSALARAHHLYASTVHDQDALMKLDMMKTNLLRSSDEISHLAPNSEGLGQRAETLLEDFHQFCDELEGCASKLANAGLGFLAVGRYRLASEAYGAAAEALDHLGSVVEQCRGVLPVQALDSRAQVLAAWCTDLNQRSAQCWLQVATDLQYRESALCQAQQRFIEADLYSEALLCACFRKQEQLSTLPAPGYSCGPRERSLIMISTAVLWSDTVPSDFTRLCRQLLHGTVGSQDFVERALDICEAEDFASLHPIDVLVEALLKHCHGKSTADVLKAVRSTAEPFCFLANAVPGRRVKLRLLGSVLRCAQALGLPTLSLEWTLLEAVVYGLYTGGVVEEQYFWMWLDQNEMRPSSKVAMQQLRCLFEWLSEAEAGEPALVAQQGLQEIL